jgi:hypothetical protein
MAYEGECYDRLEACRHRSMDELVGGWTLLFFLRSSDSSSRADGLGRSYKRGRPGITLFVDNLRSN